MSDTRHGRGRGSTNPFQISVHKSCIVKILQSLRRSAQLLMECSQGTIHAGESIPRTSSSLFVELSLMYSMMFPCLIHSDMVTKGPSGPPT